MKRLCLSALLAVATLLVGAPGHASDYPNKPIRLIVPFPPGGGNDVLARVVAHSISEKRGYNVIVENKPGAGGVVGTEYVAEAQPDGYTLLMGSLSTLAGNPSYNRSLPFDISRDFTAVTALAKGPFVLVVPQSSPANSIEEFLSMAKQQPGVLNYGTPGSGSSMHLVTESFVERAGIDVHHIAYKGIGDAVTDLLAGRIQFLLTDMSPVQPYVEAGRLKALGVSSDAEFSLLSNLKPINKNGAPGFVAEGWYGFVGPANIPADVLSDVNAVLRSVSEDPAFIAKMEQLKLEVWLTSPEDFSRFITNEVAKWSAVAEPLLSKKK